MVRRRLRTIGAVLVIVVAFVTPVLVTSAVPASADTVVDGCTIVSNPTAADFTNCPGTNLGDANLSGLNLSFANFAGASFVDCGEISGGECNAANLLGATLTSANLSGGSFFDAVPYAPCGVPSCLGIASGTVDMSGANLSSADLSSAELFGINLTNAVLTNANLTSATFTGCVAHTVVCRGGATLTGANLTGATLTKTDFSGTILVPSDESVFGTSSGAVITWPAPQSLPGATPGTCTASSGSNFPLGTTTVTCQVLDDHGDVATGTFTLAVSQVVTSINLTSSVSGSVGVGALVIYTVTVDPNLALSPNAPALSGGTVAFTENGTPIAGCAAVPLVEEMTGPAEASCSVTFSSTGTPVIQSIYSGSGVFEGSDSSTITQNVASTTAPTASVVFPANGADITGRTWLGAAASSSVGVASVTFEVSGPSASNTVIARGTLTPYGWLASWDTSTSVFNGTFTLQSVVTDVDGTSSTSAPITITVANPLAATSVIVPSSGATQSGAAALLDASASGNGYYSTGVYKVTFEVSGGPSNLSDQVIATGTATVYGWLARWNTTTVANGTYTLQSVATYTGGGTVSSSPISIAVNNMPPTTSVIVPSTGATQSGTAAALDATTSANVTKVIYELSGGPSNLSDHVIATGIATVYGWLAQWNTNTVADGTYTLQSVASYTGGDSSTSPGISVSVAN